MNHACGVRKSGKNRCGICLLLSKIIKRPARTNGPPELTSPSDGRIAINSTYVSQKSILQRELRLHLSTRYIPQSLLTLVPGRNYNFQRCRNQILNPTVGSIKSYSVSLWAEYHRCIGITSYITD